MSHRAVRDVHRCSSLGLLADVAGRARTDAEGKWNPRSPEPEHVASRIAAAEAKDPDLGVFARMAVLDFLVNGAPVAA